jgi:hypothetical protein
MTPIASAIFTSAPPLPSELKGKRYLTDTNSLFGRMSIMGRQLCVKANYGGAPRQASPNKLENLKRMMLLL